MKKHILRDDELFEIKAREYERGLKDAKLEVTKGFIEKWAKALKAEVLIEMEWKNTLPINIFIAGMEEMLREAGVSIA